MKKQILLTIIVPTFNSGQFLGEALRHLKEQSDQRFKVIIIDDNSSDQTISIAKNYASKMNIEIIKKSSKIKKGAAASLNYALQLVETKFFALIDSDAYLDINWVDAMIRILQHEKITGAPILALREAGAVAYVCGLEIESRYDRLKEGRLRHLSTCNLAGRAELVKFINLDESLDYAYDHQLSFQLKKNGIFFFLTKRTFCHHVNKGGLLNFFRQQYKIAKHHAFLSKSMKKEALQGDEISPSYLLLQPVFLSMSALFLFFNFWVSAVFLAGLLLLNIHFIIYVGKKYFFYLPVAFVLVILKNLAWIFGAPAGLITKK